MYEVVKDLGMHENSKKKKEYNIYRNVSSSRLNKSVGIDIANFSCKIHVATIEDINQTKAAT